MTPLTATLTITQTNTTGMYSLTVVDPIFGNINLANAFQVNASATLPSLKTVTPNSGTLKQTMNIVISGSTTHFTVSSSSLIVNFLLAGNVTNKITVNSKTIVTDSTINCSITIDSLATLGNYGVQVTDLMDGTINLTNAFSVGSVGINSLQGNVVAFDVYPNPANTELNFILNNNSSATLIQISDITGKVLKSILNSQSQLSLDITDLSNGIYFCTVSGKDFTTTKKIIISK
ncbi:MAG: T9SS type A sorting domain-containing protein [Bacteroidia bacterium]